MMMDHSVSPAGKVELFAQASKGKPGFARIWRGETRAIHADEYSSYLYEFGVLKIERMPGNLGVQMFRSVNKDTASFTVISFWPSLQAIAVWSGEDLTRTRHLERDPEFLLELPKHVTLVEVIANDWQIEGLV